MKNRVATRPDEIWATDITYVRLGSGFVYLSVILDLFIPAVRGWHLSRSLEGDVTLIALRNALESRCCPQIHHSDQRVQYAASNYVKLLQSHEVQIFMAAVGYLEEVYQKKRVHSSLG